MTLKERYYYVLLTLAYWMLHYRIMPMQASNLARYAWYSVNDIWTRQALAKQGIPDDGMLNDMAIEQESVPYRPVVCSARSTCAYKSVCAERGLKYICPHMLVFGGWQW